ncbi:glycosyltransferase family 9 protein [Marinomonas algarum]|uniref:Glycosyltransferase family 9 protein n=1 Tax=Marinomonas algarum TaxID=2883105 RepID=A0A9X1LFI2_9GAMM|nr:glycosyltransferase family 9 protein [Marinomonas algarum]MCB5163001.1 glycosyltransferase family 9 protein [Marinomonas algarum]
MKHPWLKSMKNLWFEQGAFVTKKARNYITSDLCPKKVRKITVIRHAALGDQVILRPFLVEARRFFPNATITLVGVSHYQYGMPYDLVDQTHIMLGKSKDVSSGLKARLANIKALGEQDIIFDLAGTNRSYWMTFLTKAKLKVGFPYRSLHRGTLYNLCVLRSDFQAEVETMLDMLRVLGHNPPRRLDFAYPDNQDFCNKSAPFILYFNGASQLRKVLSKEQMRDVIEKSIKALPNVRHIYLEGKNDFEKGDYLEYLTKQHTHFTIQPCLELDKLVQLIAQSSLLVAPDTGVRNIGISTHTPTVGIFFSTVPFRYTPRYEDHYIVMRDDATVPSSDEIVDTIRQAIRCGNPIKMLN